MDKFIMEAEKSAHKWTFFKAGGFYQANISCGEDIANIGKLDKKLWAALGCPTDGVVFDKKTLELIDSDGDGKIRSEELISASEWTCALLKDVSILVDSSPELRLSEINDATPDGAEVLSGAERVLSVIGRGQNRVLRPSDFDDSEKIFSQTAFNADGIITAASCGGDANLESAFAAILSSCGGKRDRSGADGIDAQAISDFYDSASASSAWRALPKSDASILPLGDSTAAAYGLFIALRPKIEDFFMRGRLLRFAPSASDSAATAAEIEKILSKDISEASEQLRALPISNASESELTVSSAINPAWASDLKTFADTIVSPILGDGVKSLSSESWGRIKSAFVPYEAWLKSKPVGAASELSDSDLDSVLKLNLRQKLLDLVAADLAAKPEVDGILKAEKLVRFKVGLYKLMRNFVNFSSFYKEDEDAIFQCGKLFIDQRMCKLCISVSDAGAHAAMSPLSYGYILYCTCKRKGKPDMGIAAIVTEGDSDNLIVGRHGVFYDADGADWDAVVTKIVANPIGIRQAFFSPYKRFVQWISEQVAKRAAAADASVAKSLEDSPQALADPKKKMDIGTVAAIGVAVGGITTAFGILINAIFGLGYWLPLGILGVLLAISIPSMAIAALKLRTRSLAPLLDANGWAINGKSRISIAFGAGLTRVAKLPWGARRGYISKEKR